MSGDKADEETLLSYANEEDTATGWYAYELEPVVLVKMLDGGEVSALPAHEAEQLILGGEAIPAALELWPRK